MIFCGSTPGRSPVMARKSPCPIPECRRRRRRAACRGETCAPRRRTRSCPLDRTAERSLEIVELVDAVGGAQAARLQVVGQVVALEALVLVAGEDAAADRVAAVARNHVQPDAPAGNICRRAAGRVDHLLAHRAVEVVLHGTVDVEAVDHQAVHGHGRLRRSGAMCRHVGLLHRARAADVRCVQRHAGDELPHPLNRAAGRHRVEHVAREHLGLGRALHVHDRGCARDGQRFLKAADLHLRIQRHREIRRQLDAFALDRRETFERKRHGVDTGSQIHQAVSAAAIGDRGLRFLDERRARRFDGHTGQHSAGVVLDDAGERALCEGRRRHQTEHSECEEHGSRSTNSQHSLTSRRTAIPRPPFPWGLGRRAPPRFGSGDCGENWKASRRARRCDATGWSAPRCTRYGWATADDTNVACQRGSIADAW